MQEIIVEQMFFCQCGDIFVIREVLYMSKNVSIILVIFCADVIIWGNYSLLGRGESSFFQQ